MGDLLQLQVPLGYVPCQGALESLDQQGSIVCVLGHLSASHLQVNHRVTPPIVLFEFRDLGGTVMLGNQDILEKFVFQRSSGPA